MTRAAVPDLFPTVRDRLRTVALSLVVVSVAAIVAFLAVWAYSPATTIVNIGAPKLVVSLFGVTIVTAGALYVLCPLQLGVSLRVLLVLAGALQILLCYSISFALKPPAGIVWIGWIIPILLYFPLVVPAPPRLVFLVTLLSGSSTIGVTSALEGRLGEDVLGSRRPPRQELAMAPPGMTHVELPRSRPKSSAIDRVARWFKTRDKTFRRVLHTTLSSLTVFVAAMIAHRVSQRVRPATAIASAGDRVGRYRLVERIGAGTFGTVFRARHVQLGTEVAVKFVRADTPRSREYFGRAERLSGFMHEIRLMSELESPHTVSILEAGATDEGDVYIVMEFIRLPTLGHYVRGHDGGVPESDSIEVLRQVTTSIFEAHEQGVVHYDLKPNNVMVGPYGSVGTFAKVLDFGLARELDRHGVLADPPPGTERFSAPEQRGAGNVGSFQSDIYAIGKLGYYLLNGETLGDDTPAPEKWPRRDRVRPATIAFIEACVAVDPDDRPESAAAVLDQLDGLASP